ncbi:MAG TPA: VTT domain-containing protein [Anaerolineales bacterium]|nr:TVP38/TMEM64 family protein [Anaerolineales bacterium]HMR99708.1 VTT domain-containing protein [Anaerolineales bacterium]HNQ95456.1 VTT domain-containing protein [Anaerolineales bacterium]HNS61476.1 VTT domain-containing protein [Anaerolineales bacterium]
MSLQKVILYSSIVLSLILLWVYRLPIMQSLRWFSNLDAVIESIRGYGYWGPAVLFLLFILQAFIAFIPGQALMIASGYIYGFIGGILITWTSLVLGGQIAFWLSRKFGRPFAEKWIAPATLDRWDKSAAGQGVAFYVITLVMPLIPNDAMCYVAGLGSMEPRRFLLANMLGRGIASILTVTVGAYVNQIPALIWVFLVGFVVLGVAGWFVARRYQRANQP